MPLAWRLPRVRQLSLTFPLPRSRDCPEAVQYYGLSAPAGIPRAIIERFNKELRSMIESEELTKRIVADGGDPIAR